MKWLVFSVGHLVWPGQYGCKIARFALVAPSFNGRTAASGAAYRGSNPWGAATVESGTYLQLKPARKHSVLVASSTCLVHFGARGMAHLYGTHLVEGPLTNGLPTSKKRSRRFTSRVTPMRTVVLMCAVSRTAVPSQSGPLAHRSTPSKRRSISNAAASRPGSRATALPRQLQVLQPSR
jgi:hypothetical protein